MKIVISGFYGLGNTGDEAILDSIIDNLRSELDEPEITVFSLSPGDTGKKHNVHSIYRGWRHQFKDKVRALKEADLVVSGGGGLLQDTYPTRIIFGPLPYYLLIVFLAKMVRTKVMFFSQGIGPVTTPYGKALMKTFGNLADYVTVRDQYSLDYLRDLGVTRPEGEVTADIVFAYQTKDDDTAYQSLSVTGEEKLVGVSVRPWFQEEQYKKEMAELLDGLIEERGVTPVFIPMEGHHDTTTSKEVQSYMKKADQTLLLGDDFTPNQYVQFMKHCETVIGMRLHSLIFASIMGVPFSAISYDKKVESLAKRTGLWDYSTTLEDFTAATLLGSVKQVFDDREKLARDLDKAQQELRQEALHNVEILKQRFGRD
ncbi:polysaccharide pyruvyl transferase CsaB [Salimicrobium halophilum]|uniref:Polysaccharide pyruvyl transferase CsaB n=1 Tax=Salimicrobium halophilum TaxID=86666 RepID=A0A1G8SEX0_9BACI|nr:polysaccharide pyruvyl transferase CsaB [Salimicrobium halophilum]SDJ27751.1 polysaccharide pyruvyl transferase CsaB [Salimicrobium halophilum]